MVLGRTITLHVKAAKIVAIDLFVMQQMKKYWWVQHIKTEGTLNHNIKCKGKLCCQSKCRGKTYCQIKCRGKQYIAKIVDLFLT